MRPEILPKPRIPRHWIPGCARLKRSRLAIRTEGRAPEDDKHGGLKIGVKGLPVGIGGFDEFEFFDTGPFFKLGFALDSGFPILVMFGIDEEKSFIFVCKLTPLPCLMLPFPAGKVGRYANVKCAVAA